MKIYLNSTPIDKRTYFKTEQIFSLMSFIVERMRNGIDILVGTPGRIKDHVQNGKLDLTKLKHVVLDEVDHMLDMGFADQVEEILCVAYKKGKP
jgi:superfamily II DNA/RNA helicase